MNQIRSDFFHNVSHARFGILNQIFEDLRNFSVDSMSGDNFSYLKIFIMAEGVMSKISKLHYILFFLDCSILDCLENLSDFFRFIVFQNIIEMVNISHINDRSIDIHSQIGLLTFRIDELNFIFFFIFSSGSNNDCFRGFFILLLAVILFIINSYGAKNSFSYFFLITFQNILIDLFFICEIFLMSRFFNISNNIGFKDNILFKLSGMLIKAIVHSDLLYSITNIHFLVFDSAKLIKNNTTDSTKCIGCLTFKSSFHRIRMRDQNAVAASFKLESTFLCLNINSPFCIVTQF